MTMNENFNNEGKDEAKTIPEMPATRPRTQKMPARRGLLFKLVRENLGIKVLSLILAVALFTLVRTERGNEAEIDIPVILTNISEDQVFVGTMPSSIKVMVRDRWSRLTKALERKASPYAVDLRGFKNGSVFVFDREKIRQAIGVEGLYIHSIYPSEFTVNMEPNVEITVPIKLNPVGKASTGYTVPTEEARLTPSEVSIKGAKSSVSPIRELATYPVDISSLKRDSVIEVQIQKPSSKFLSLNVDRVRVEIPVQEIQSQKVFDQVPVKIRNCPDDYVCSVVPELVDVTLSGSLPTIFDVQEKRLPLEIYVDASDFDPRVSGHPGIRPACERPAGLKCTESPKSVSLTIQKETAPR
ncbi:MAG TPA: CdaR family protein [Myxococcota bacterium]|nr:CdaR family protein [Myxococcota bacterium]